LAQATPARIACADRFTPPVLHAANGQHVIQLISQAQAAAGTTWHAATLETCLGKLGTFRLSRQITTLNRVLDRLTDAPSARLPGTAARPR
jgi:hypothetical protein